MSLPLNSLPLNNLATIIIAAGNSSRLGQSKQLVKFENQTLLNRSIQLAIALTNHVTVVLGSNQDIHQSSILNDSVKVVNNSNWQVGMGMSIACGINSLESNDSEHSFDGVLIMLCDQWMLKPDDLNSLITTWNKDTNKLVCSDYMDQRIQKQVLGAPAIFPRQYFNLLKELTKTGARKIIQQHSKDVVAVNLANAGYDLDTPDDLTFLNNHLS